MPSEAYETWEKYALQQCFRIKAQLRSRGIELPITQRVSLDAQIYRETAVGDAAGFYQAIADMLQKAEILHNDSQIEDWDGSRRLKDAARPRVEIYLTILDPIQGSVPGIE